MSEMITTHQLTKTYGDATVVNGVSLRVPHGCVYGFLGPNGSGKSTTMKMLLSLVHPTGGEIHIAGRPMTQAARRELLGDIGSLIEAPPGYGHLTGRENLRITQRMRGLSGEQVAWAAATVRLEEHLDKRVRHYSLGMKQRLGIAMALACQPRVLILDEPTNGLDPAGIDEIRGLLRRLAHNGVTVMVSSHLLGEIDKTATVLGILSNGRMLFQGTREELFAKSTPDILIETPDPRRATTVAAQWYPARHDEAVVRIPGLDPPATAAVVAGLVGSGIDIHGVRRDEQTLEDVFFDLTSGGGL